MNYAFRTVVIFSWKRVIKKQKKQILHLLLKDTLYTVIKVLFSRLHSFNTFSR